MAEAEFNTSERESEEWRPVVGYEGFYQVSSLGRVRRCKWGRNTFIGRILRPGSSNGYPHVNLCNGSGSNKKHVAVHLLVAAAFIGPCPPEMEVNHRDNNPGNPRATNLEYLTHQQNMAYAARQGRMTGPRGPQPHRAGDNSHTAKMTSSDVIAIRRAILAGVPGTVLSEHYGVTTMTISHIKSGRSWKHLSELRDQVAALGSHKTRHKLPRGLRSPKSKVGL